MSDETNRPKFGIVENVALTDEEMKEELKAEEENTKERPDDVGVKQLMHFRNLKIYLNKMVGKDWMLLYRREEDGAPVFVPNENLSSENQIFLSELSKNIVFQMMRFMGEEDN